MDIKINWTQFKGFADGKSLFVQYDARTDHYRIWAEDGGMTYICVVDITDPAGTDQIDFETNYKDGANRPMTISPSSAQSFFEGKQIEITSGNNSGYAEWVFTQKTYINKITAIPISAIWGDYIELEMYMDGVGKVGGYAKTIYLYGDKPTGIWYYGNGGGEIPSGIKVRCTYHAVDTDGRKFIIHAEFLTTEGNPTW